MRELQLEGAMIVARVRLREMKFCGVAAMNVALNGKFGIGRAAWGRAGGKPGNLDTLVAICIPSSHLSMQMNPDNACAPRVTLCLLLDALGQTTKGDPKTEGWLLPGDRDRGL